MPDTQYPIAWKESFVHDVGLFREWLGQRDDLILEDNKPVWWHLARHRGWDNLEELLAVSEQEHNVFLDWKDEKGRGWLWAMLSWKAPSHLVLLGLDRLGPDWDQKDALGVDPLSLATEGQCIHGIARRLWRENPMTCQHRIRQLASTAPTPAALRAWQFWSHGIHSINEPGQH